MIKHNTPLKIGIDARALSQPITGIGRYTLEVCKAFSKMKDVKLYLYSPSPINQEIMHSLRPATIRNASLQNKIYRQVWSEFVLPFWIKKDCVDVFWGPAHRLPRLLSESIASVVTIHDLVWKYAGSTMHPMTRVLERMHMPAAIKNAHHIVADSQATATDVMKDFVVKETKISVVKLGADHIKQSTDKGLLGKLSIHQPYFLFVGTLEPRKNLLNLLISYAALPDDVRSKAMMVIVGGQGWGGLKIDEKIQQLKLENHVKLLGYVDDKTLQSLYSHAKFVTMPSLYEGFGLPLVEAMSCGIPLLTSNNSSMKEIAGSAAILVDPLDIDSIKDGLFSLITDDKIHRKLAKHAQNNAKQFTWNETANQLISVFKKVRHA